MNSSRTCHSPKLSSSAESTACSNLPVRNLVLGQGLFNLSFLLFGALVDLFRSRGNLVFENFVLRQQLAMLKRRSSECDVRYIRPHPAYNRGGHVHPRR